MININVMPAMSVERCLKDMDMRLDHGHRHACELPAVLTLEIRTDAGQSVRVPLCELHVRDLTFDLTKVTVNEFIRMRTKLKDLT